MFNYRRSGIVAAILIAASLEALATQPSSGGDSSALSVAEANSLAVGLGIGLGLGVSSAEGGDAAAFAGGGDAESNAAVVGSGNSYVSDTDLTAQGQGQDQDQAQTLDSDVVTGDVSTDVATGDNAASSDQGQSLNYNDSSKFLSLALPGATADPGTTAPCTESRRGWSFFGASASGRTRINETCYDDAKLDRDDRREFEQCMSIAQHLFAAGAEQAAISQLNRCQGPVDVTVAVSEIRQDEAASSTTEFATKEELNRAFAAAQAK
jgi:hypothetical protein